MATTRIRCPGCASQGRDNSGNNLNIFHGNPKKGWCYVCNKSYPTEADISQNTYSRAPRPADIQMEIAAIKSWPTRALEHKPISKEICEKFGVRVSISEETGRIEKVAYPYFDPYDGTTITGFKIRVVATKDFYTVGKMKSLFGQNICKANAQLLLITEGEDDTLSCAEMHKILGKDYNVVSIPNGANESATVDSVIREQLDFIIGHKNVIPFFDWDVPGKLSAKLISDFLCSQTTVKVFLNSYKDAGEYLKAGKIQKYKQDLFSTKEYRPASIVKGSDISLEEIMAEDPPGFLTPYPLLNNKLLGLRPGEITLVVAGSGIGKSSLVKELAYDLVVNHNQCVANIFLETQYKDAPKGFVAIDNNVPLWKLKRDRNALDRDSWDQSSNKLFKSDKIHILRHHGGIHPDELVRNCNYFVKVLGVQWIILDHISMVFSGHETDNERKDIDKLMTKLAEFVVQTGAGILAVVHLKRVTGKNFNRGAEVELTDLRGSAALEQLAFNVIGLERDLQGDSRDISKIRVLKNRTIGYTGLADQVKFDHDTGRLFPHEVTYG